MITTGRVNKPRIIIWGGGRPERDVIPKISYFRIKVNNILTWFLANVNELSYNMKKLSKNGSIVTLG
jgi:hypothetical protein